MSSVSIEYRVTYRRPLTIKKWDGDPTTFKDSNEDLKSQVYLLHMGYIVEPSFLVGYLQYGDDVVNIYPHHVRSIRQLHADRQYFHGVLQAIFNVQDGRAIFQNHTLRGGSPDGILEYIDILSRLDIHNEVRLRAYNEYIKERYASDSPGGLHGYVGRIQNAYMELADLGVDIPQQQRFDAFLSNYTFDADTTRDAKELRRRLRSKSNCFDILCDELRRDYFDEELNKEFRRHSTLQQS